MFEPGDVLLYTAKLFNFSAIISSLIRLVTGNKIVHVGLYLGKNKYGEHLILDALPNRVSLKTFKTKKSLISRKDNLKLYGIARLSNINKANYESILWSTHKYVDKPYGFLTIFNLLLQHGKTLLFPKLSWTSWFKSKKGYICSEVTQLVIEETLRREGIKFTFSKPACLVEPDDYLSFPWEVKVIK